MIRLNSETDRTVGMKEGNMKKLFNYGPLLVIVAASLWAFDGIIRRSLYTLPSITIVFYEHLVGALILLPYLLKTITKEKLTRREFFLLVFISAFSGVLGGLWFTTALLKVNFISFSVVYLIQKLQPIFTISTARLVLKEKINRKFIKWAILAMAAAYFVTFKNGVINFSTGAGTVVAALYALGAAFAWGSSTAFSKLALQKKPSTYITALRFVFTSILAFGMVFALGQSKSLPTLTLSQLARFILIAVSTGMVAVVIYYKGLKKVPASVSTILELVYPMLAVIIDAVLYKSFLAPSQYLAAAVLLFSIYRISRLQKNAVQKLPNKR